MENSRPLGSFGDILTALNEIPLTNSELDVLWEKLVDLRSLHCNRLTQHFPPDLWKCIFQEASFPTLPLPQLLPHRLVCKAWNPIISGFTKIETDGIKWVDRVLEVFPDLQHFKLTPKSVTDFTTLTKLTHLRLQGPVQSLSRDLQELASCTNLYKLTISKSIAITSLGPLTSLGCLSLASYFSISRSHVESRTHITRLISTKKSLFWDNPGRYKGPSFIYDGGFQKGKLHGECIILFTSGARYEGRCENDNKHGHGKYIKSDGRSYEGTYAKGNKVHGRSVDKKGAYEGPFCDDRPWGKGVLLPLDGSRYEGDVQDGKKHGYGVLTLPDGSTQAGHWNMDSFQPDLPTRILEFFKET